MTTNKKQKKPGGRKRKTLSSNVKQLIKTFERLNDVTLSISHNNTRQIIALLRNQNDYLKGINVYLSNIYVKFDQLFQQNKKD